MTEVTRVPIQPIAKGSLTKLWLGLAIGILIGIGIALVARPDNSTLDALLARDVDIKTLVQGAGPNPQDGEVVFVKYVGKFTDGEVFDESQPLPFDVGDLIPAGTPFSIAEGQTIEGFQIGLKQMQKGGKYELFIPSEKGYGDDPQPGSPIPPGSDLIFEIEVVDILAQSDFERRVSVLQQMMQQQQGGPPVPGAPVGPPPGPPPGQ